MPVLSFTSSALCKSYHRFHTFLASKMQSTPLNFQFPLQIIHRKSNGGQNRSGSPLLCPRETNILLTYGRLGRKAQGSNTLHNAVHKEMSWVDYGTGSQRHLWWPFENQITYPWYFIIKSIVCKHSLNLLIENWVLLSSLRQIIIVIWFVHPFVPFFFPAVNWNQTTS